MTSLRRIAQEALEDERTANRKVAIKVFKDILGVAPDGIENVKGTTESFIFKADGLIFRVSKILTLAFDRVWRIEVRKVDGYSWYLITNKVELAKLIEYGSV